MSGGLIGRCGGGGGSVVFREGLYSANDLVLLNTDDGFFSWLHLSGDAVLDLSTPLHPTAIYDGIYAVSADVFQSAGVVAAGGVWGMTVYKGAAISTGWSFFSPSGQSAYEGTLTLVQKVSAGDAFTVRIKNSSGATLTFSSENFHVTVISTS